MKELEELKNLFAGEQSSNKANTNPAKHLFFSL
jgi:hypothetical protein